MKDMHCRDAGLDCDFVIRGETDDEILSKAGRHAKDQHQLDVTPNLQEKIRGLIHDESSEEHKRSMRV